MSHLRIVCKTQKPEAPVAGYPLLVPIADFADCEIFAVSDDGTEVSLSNVSAVQFRVGADSSPASATLTFFNVDLDADASFDAGRIAYEAFKAARIADGFAYPATWEELDTDVHRAWEKVGRAMTAVR